MGALILSWLAAIPWKTIGGAFGFALWERWLGRTSSTPAGSTLDLLTHLWQYHKWGPTVPKPVPATVGTGGPPPDLPNPKDEKIPMSNFITKSIKVSKAVDDAFTTLTELIADAIEGKPAAELQGDVIALLGLFGELKDIAPDYTADHVAVEDAAVLGAVTLGRRVLASLKTKAAQNPK